VQTVFSEYVESGLDYSVDLVPLILTSGVYFYSLTIGREVINGKVIKKNNPLS